VAGVSPMYVTMEFALIKIEELQCLQGKPLRSTFWLLKVLQGEEQVAVIYLYLIPVNTGFKEYCFKGLFTYTITIASENFSRQMP
jgi:hypothetical protein